ncbi:MAG: hypothetical protein IPM53_33095 [Anaerolineaceae bacterium]|nr:hypothetical protein [Anaerolineaceae bacterium]
MKKGWIMLIFAFLGMVLVSHINGGVAAEPLEPLAPAASDPLWNSIGRISQTSGITGAIQPSIATYGSGSKIIVAYSGIFGNNNSDHDVYYSTSTNYGATWPTKARIHQSPGSASDSSLIDVAISPNNKGHAVWVEEVGDTPRIVYKYEDNWGNNTTNLRVISQPAIPVALADPRIVAKNNNRLDVVWSQGEATTNINIYHAYSTSSTGSTWQGKAPIVDTSDTSRLPDIAIDASGNYHVVWEEGPDPTRIFYLRGVPSGNAVNWSVAGRINISQKSIPNNITAATQPKIYTVGNILHVTYTNFINKEQQYVHHLQCNANCSNLANWFSVGNPISGQVLGAKAADPFDVISTIGQVGSCTYVYFHGIQGTSNSNNERIWGVNSCGDWAASARDQVTGSDVRAINPAMESANNWWLFLAYEQVNTDSSLREVYFVRNKPAIYLPMIRK